MELTPRLSQILFLLIHASAPIPAQTLADELQISKRTIFRELEYIDSILNSYGLTLDTRSKKGMQLHGEESDRARLLQKLETIDDSDPLNKENRKIRLIQKLMHQDLPQKIYYFAAELQVSEGTVNNDLEQAEVWFEKNRIRIMKKPGLGIFLNYEEEDYRKAFLQMCYEFAGNPLKDLPEWIDKRIVEEVKKAVEEQNHSAKINFAEDSYQEFLIYLSIMTKRVKQGRYIGKELAISLAEKETLNYRYVRDILKKIEGRIVIRYPQIEADYLYIYVKGSKLQAIVETEELTQEHYDLQYIVYQMIDRYDPVTAYEFKLDNDLVRGLIAHLKPTMVRLQYNIKINNPYQKEVTDLYQETYEKTERAAGVLEEVLGSPLPIEEIGLLALHFGGAKVREQKKKEQLRKIQVGVVCASGIGISALLSSRLSHIFHDRVIINSYGVQQLSAKNFQQPDILLSTLELPLAKEEYIKIHPMLTEEDIKRIKTCFERVDQQKEQIDRLDHQPMLDRIEDITRIGDEVASIIKNFQVYDTDSGISFNELIKKCGKALGKGEKEALLISRDIEKREALNTQVIPEYELTLLHAKTEGTDNSVFSLFIPQKGRFLAPYFRQSKVVIVMLLPKENKGSNYALSSISTRIFEDERFLAVIKQGDHQTIQKMIEQTLNIFLNNYIKGGS